MLGGIIWEVGSRPMRAGKGSLATPLKRSIGNWKNLAWANTSREIGGASCTFKELGAKVVLQIFVACDNGDRSMCRRSVAREKCSSSATTVT